MRHCNLYRVVHRDSGADYIGISVNTKKRWYHHVYQSLHSPTGKFHRALAKYGKEAFAWKVIARTSCTESAKTLERLAIALGMGSLNLTKGGDGNWGWTPSEETKSKISKTLTGVKCPPRSEAYRQAIRDSWKDGKRKGTKWTPEQKEKWIALRIGQKRSPETRARMSEAGKARNFKWSEEDKKRMSEQAKARGYMPHMRAWNERGKADTEGVE